MNGGAVRELRSPEKFAMDYLVPLISCVQHKRGVFGR